MTLIVEISVPGGANTSPPQAIARSLIGAGNRLIVIGQPGIIAATHSECRNDHDNIALVQDEASGEDRIASLTRARDILRSGYPGAVFLPVPGPLTQPERDHIIIRLFGADMTFPHTDALVLYMGNEAA